MHGNADAEQAHRRRGEEVVQGCRVVQSGREVQVIVQVIM